MNKKALKGLRREEDILNEIKDIKSQIRDYEDELEWVSGDGSPNNAKYVTSLMNRIDKLYSKLDELDTYEIN
tara:strand:+ start:222 stop:437 length:216 start_codon:yes stop_codon:yes gene_type:complete